MSVANEITRLQNAKADIKTSIENKGVTVGDGTIDTYASKIDEISTSSAVLGTKKITTNGTYKAIDDNLDGYSEVNVETSGVDINEYYDLEYTPTECYPIKYIKKIPLIDTSKATSMTGMFSNYLNLQTIPELDTSKVTNMSSMFSGCSSLQTIPLLDTSKVTSMKNMFYNCSSLQTIPQLDTSNVTNINAIFSGCSSLQTIPKLDVSNIVNTAYERGIDSMFNGCLSLQTIPQLDTSNVTSMNSTFSGCSSLQTIPQLDTSNVTDMRDMFDRCSNLTTIPELDANKVTDINNAFASCSKLTQFGGLLNLGQSYSTTQSANYYGYTLTVSSSTKLTHDSLMNVINGLYDIKTKGCNPQSLSLGATNLAKLTSEEIAIATEKGWNVS